MPKLKCWVGIDPGLNGGLFAIAENGAIKSWKMPVSGGKVDANGLYSLFSKLNTSCDVTVVIEEVHSIFGTSASSNFTFGFVCGMIEAIVISHQLRFSKVQPKIWQKEIWLSSEVQYKALKEGKTKKSIDTKLTSQMAARRLFPKFDFRGTERSKKDHDGIIDAALIAEYGKRKNI